MYGLDPCEVVHVDQQRNIKGALFCEAHFAAPASVRIFLQTVFSPRRNRTYISTVSAHSGAVLQNRLTQNDCVTHPPPSYYLLYSYLRGWLITRRTAFRPHLSLAVFI